MLPHVQAGRRDLERAADALASRLPEPLGVFARLAYNYRWAWAADGPDVFRSVDPERWDRCAENPVRLLEEAPADRLPAAAADEALLGRAPPPAQEGRGGRRGGAAAPRRRAGSGGPRGPRPLRPRGHRDARAARGLLLRRVRRPR